MRVLILGGTVFLGRHFVAEALARGDEVTIFTRGIDGADLFPGAERLRGDRTRDLSALAGGSWDVAVDTSGYEPEHVATSSRLLDGAVEHLTFVSSASAYRDWPGRAVDETSPIHQRGDDYGALKAACERAAEEAMPGRVAHLRAGVIVGPYDHVFRLPWWVTRIARGGRVLAPGRPGRPLQLVDARDLAAWALDLAAARRSGVWNATAPVGQTTMCELLEVAASATASRPELVWAPDERLLAAGVEEWTEMPLWAAEAQQPGTFAIDASRAARDGLRCRPVAETVADVAAWLRDGGADRLPAWRAENRAPGMTPQREAALLAELA